ncbi:ATP-dependent RNA helicase DEAH12, chloroplastic-like protein [Cinnamomum micranthum f. kanehirae]|uniref:RNA helicase n=1 Tax=Cinnamomum micranthum f. kanehirae TaxID=337451 RepID=A0A443PNZ9_9MAGN|nr:ATP-dependent RNA helicase DEAH12, chloroplastic-like protein [Cinnamomum micranthum f. kanehirae]
MRRGVLPTPPSGRPPLRQPKFTVELQSGRRPFQKSDVEALISACPSAPNSYSIDLSSPVAAKLFFYYLQPAIDAVVFFWSRRLDGSHSLTPDLVSPVRFPADEISDRLSLLFRNKAHDLLDGDGVRRRRERVSALSEEIMSVKASLRKLNRVSNFINLGEKTRALEEERGRIEKRVEEFRAAMRSILKHLDGPEWEGCEEEWEEVFGFGEAGLDWSRIHNMMTRECRRLEEGLPIYDHRREILHQLHSNQVLILIGETGSGKSTQLVQYLADSGAAADGSIICTQPRKIAAVSLARRVREETDGCYAYNSVACYQTYSSNQRLNYEVIFMTDHCLLQHIMYDRNLDGISCIVVDEAHERSLNTDLLLALIKRKLLQRQDFRLIIMSATVDSCKLSNYFGCKTFHVKGRSFPVEIKYVPDVSAECMWAPVPKYDFANCASYVIDAVKMAIKIHKTEEAGAILAFLTSQSEVEWACENFHVPSAIALPLHGKLSCEEQSHVFQNYPGKRKVIFATNLAETSLTIPGVKYVVDSGMAKESHFEPGSGMNVLRVCKINQSSANQRAGRAGRTEPGICYRLYSESDFQTMESHMKPEICKVHLGIAILRILSLGTKDIKDFDFVDAPSPEAIEKAISNLLQLGAVIHKNGVLVLTDSGQYLVRLGMEPRLGKLVLDAFHCGLRKEGLVLAAVMANASSIFCRVGSNEDKSKSDRHKVQFCHRDGDLFTLLSVYKDWEAVYHESRNKWCWENSINAKSMRRCRDTVHELEECLKHEFRYIVPSFWKWDPHVPTTYHKTLKMIILSSLGENIAMYSGYNRLGYEIALTGQHVQLHPSCSLLVYGESPTWVVFSEILSMPNLYLVCVTAFDYECLPKLQPPPPFDVSQLEGRKMEMNVIAGLGKNLLRRFCGKFNDNLDCLVSQIREDCMDDRISIDVDFERGETRLFCSSKDVEKVSDFVNNALQFEKKCLTDECIEKCLFRGGAGFHPSVALLGAGAKIKHLELDKRFLSVEVFHSNVHSLDDKELLMMFDRCTTGIASFHKHTGLRQEGMDAEKWGKVTFLTPQSARRVVELLDGVEFHDSFLRVSPSRTAIGGDRTFPFPAIKAKVCWPRRHSKGVAIVRCAIQDVCFIFEECLNMIIGGRLVRCEISKKYMDSIVICGLDKITSEQEIYDALRNTTRRNILDVFLLRGEAVNQPSSVACEEALRREIAPFMPNRKCPINNCRVEVFSPDPKDHSMKALITFDGNLHLEAATALQHIQGKVLPGCLPWQKIQCQQLFHSSVSCPAAVYPVIKKQLDALLGRFKHMKGVSVSLDRTDYGSYRVRISSNATKIVAELRKPLEEIMIGTTITNPRLTANIMQLLFSREGIALIKNLEKETGTFILHDKQNLNLKVFGRSKEVAEAEQKLVQSLLHLHENKQLEIRLRGSGLPQNLMKEVVQNFGPDLHGLKGKVPGAEFVLDTRRHILSVQGSKELKRKVEDIIFEMAESLNGALAELSNSEETCPICLCEVEDCYRLEACGHGFCFTCLVDQCESAIRSHDGFPLCCAREGCKSPIFVVDLKFLLSVDKLEELFRSSLGAFVASSGGLYRFCPSPDCPAVYRVADPEAAGEQPPFACGACFVETCRKCRLEYHPYMSCEKYKMFKKDPDASLIEWRKGKDDVKNCPSCGYTIEKAEGCNHMECKCGKHICWFCLECFDASDECYGHLRTVHFSII